MGLVEREPSASPAHDWNERITAECYRPNSAARLLDAHGAIAELHNNFESMSFNIGPTLHAWLAEHAPDVGAAIVAADVASAARRRGHGNAISLPYVHAILPLAVERDRTTMVAWGIADFEARFGRAPEGMWLPETAVDTPTLETLAAAGIAFTILAPHQVSIAAEPLGDGGTEPTDTPAPCVVRLPSGRSITVVPFDGLLSRAVAFEPGLLQDGDGLARRLAGAVQASPELLTIATDGETFGHHHRFGEMALARAMTRLDARPGVTLTNPGAALAAKPATVTAGLVEATSWSCAHGIERWRSNCGCQTGGDDGWTQEWRTPLREALDWLRDRLAAVFDEAGGAVFTDPWAARDDYLSVLIDPGTTDAFLERHGRGAPDPVRATRALRLLEMQRHALLMFTSCGWFFADAAGLETVLILRHAARAAELGTAVLGPALLDELVERLAVMRSNDPREGDGRAIWTRRVLPDRADAVTLAAGHAARATVGDPGPTRLGDWRTEPLTTERFERDGACLAVGIVRVGHAPTQDQSEHWFAALDAGDHELVVAVDETGASERAAVADEFRDHGVAAARAWLAGRPVLSRYGGLPAPDREWLCRRWTEDALPAVVVGFAVDDGLTSQMLDVSAGVLDRAFEVAADAVMADPARMSELDGLVRFAGGKIDDGPGPTAARRAVLALDATRFGPSERDKDELLIRVAGGLGVAVARRDG